MLEVRLVEEKRAHTQATGQSSAHGGAVETIILKLGTQGFSKSSRDIE